MAKVFQEITDHIRDWVGRQPMFFVATAPLAADGHVNVSPKGPIGSLRIVDPHTVAFLDVSGSGAETIAHVRENGRITLMFCSFDRTPNVVRLHGRGHIVSLYDAEFEAWAAHFPANPAARAVVVVHLTPAMARRGADGVVAYRRLKNRSSIDGLPAFDDDDSEGR